MMMRQIWKTPHGPEQGAGAGHKESNERWNHHTMPGSAVHRGLQFVGLCGTVNSPNCKSRNKRLSDLPKAGKSLVHASAYISATGIPSAVIIGRVQRPSVREALAATYRPGSVVPAFFVLKSQNCEVSHV